MSTSFTPKITLLKPHANISVERMPSYLGSKCKRVFLIDCDFCALFVFVSNSSFNIDNDLLLLTFLIRFSGLVVIFVGIFFISISFTLSIVHCQLSFLYVFIAYFLLPLYPLPILTNRTLIMTTTVIHTLFFL